MEKYYLAKLDEPNGEILLAKLVDIQFARRPPTFGTLYLTETDSCDSTAQQSLKLNLFNLGNDQQSKFTSNRDINLAATLSEALRQKTTTVIDLNTLNEQLLLELSHSSTSVQRLRSSSFVLTQSGDLCVISMIDLPAKAATVCKAKQSDSGERFLSFRLSLQRQEDVLDHQLASKSQPALEVHLLSEQTYYHYNLLFKSDKLDCDAQLLNKYSTQDSNRIDRSLKFTQFWPINKRDPNGTIILLKLNDSSRRFVKNGKCLQTIVGNNLNGEESEILAPPAQAGQETILLEYFNHKLVAYSLLINDDHHKSRPNHGTELSDDLLGDHEQSSDPDGLLPQAPSFELEECWSYELAEIDGIRSELMDEAEERHESIQPRAKLKRCSCFLWPPETRTSSSSSKPASNHDDELISGPSRGWPKFLLVASYSHLLLFCFEHEEALPFSVIYDRAFLGLMDGGGNSEERIQQQASGAKSIDPKLKPKLLFNFKLVGRSPSDSLMNLLFLTQKISQLKHFNQLGLFVCLTSEHHLLALKFSSPDVVQLKDNLYQQSVLVSLRQPALLSDEIQRVESINSKLFERIAALEAGQLDLNQTRGAVETESLIHVSLGPDQVIGGLYKLKFVWPTVANLASIVVVSTVDLRFLPSQDGQNIKSMKLNNFLQDETLSSLGREALFLDIKLKEPHKSSRDEELSHHESSIRAWSIVELERVKHFVSLSRNPFVEQSLTLPLFLIDGQQSEGQIRVYFVSSNPLSTAFDKRSSSHNSAMHFPEGLEANAKLPCKFIKRQVQLKSLNSYRSVDQLEESTMKTTPILKLEISGQFSDEQMFLWLNECLEIDLSKLQNQTQNGSGPSKVILHFSSNFSHCFLSVRLMRRSNKRQSEGEVTIHSDDFIALALIEKHLFKRATDDSIQLTRSAGNSLIVGVESLRHLIGRQQLNINLYLRLNRRQEASTNSGRISDSERCQQIDLILENLMSEALDLQSLPIKSELKQSTMWLERSFRQDLEQVVTSQVDSGQEVLSNDLQQCLSTFLDMICGFIIDALVDYERLHQISGPRVEAMLKMRSKLLYLVREPKLTDPLWFAERVLKHWDEVKIMDK